MSQTKLDGELAPETTGGLTAEEESLLEALDEVEQTMADLAADEEVRTAYLTV